MPRKSPRELITNIVLSLKKGPKSIQDIASDVNASWEPTAKYLESLKTAGLVEETKEGKSRVFSLKMAPANPDGETYFGFPLTEEQESKIGSLFQHIKKEWAAKTGNNPNKTQIHKTLSRVNKECDLKLPCGWYMFGSICVKRYTPNMEYSLLSITKDIQACIKETISRYAPCKSTYQLKMLQYTEEENRLYLSKEEVMADLSRGIFSNKLIRDLYGLIGHLPTIQDNTSKDVINEFIGLAVQVSKVNEAILPKVAKQQELIISFEEVWKLIATHQFYEDMKKCYPETTVERCMAPSIRLQQQVAIDVLTQLSDLIPEEEEPKDEDWARFKAGIGSASKLTEKEKNERAEKASKMSQSELFRAFGLD